MKNLLNWFRQTVLLGGMTLMMEAHAAIPTVNDPTLGKGENYFDTMRGYVYDGAIVASLIVCAVALFVVAKNAITEFNLIGEGRGTWTKFGTFIVIGVVLIVAVIWLVTEGVATLKTTQ